VKAGDLDEAYFFLEWVLRADADDSQRSQAWLWLSKLFEDESEKRLCLEQALAAEPMNPLVRRGLAVLDGRLDQHEIVDPNLIASESAANDQVHAARATHYQCPRCAGRLNYTPEGAVLVCEYCEYRQELKGPEAVVKPEYGLGAGLEQDFIAALATAKGHLQPVSMRSLQCQACGIEMLLAAKTISVTCPYCDSVYVAETAEKRQFIPPQALIPFSIDEDSVKKKLRVWFKRHKLDQPRISPIIGIYLPVWTFDIGGEIRWRGKVRRGDSWLPVSGNKHFFYDDVLVPGTKKYSGEISQVITDFDWSHLIDYDTRYLADWPAERYQLPLADASLQARKQIVTDLRKRQNKLSPDEYVRDLTLNSSGLFVESYKLVLLPVWMIHYKVEGQVYDLVVNGQTGTVHGQRPKSVVRKLFSWLNKE
jgi:DNA-directed RNA polymerase subunit RPC12/RpoP